LKEKGMKKTFRKAALVAAVTGVFAGGAGTAAAAGFALIEQSGNGMGNAFAGAAATAEDASTIFFNPAGLTRLDGRQVAFAGHIVAVSAEFTDNGNSVTAGGGALPNGGNGGNAGETAFIPNAYFSMPYGDRWFIGVGVNAPFGLVTEYDEDWVGRFQGIKSEIMTVNINPTVAYKVSDTVSVGFGVSYQQFDAELTNAQLLPGPSEGRARLEADDDGFGWNAGVLIQATPTTRIGASYRSKIDYTLEGDLNVTTSGGATVLASPATADVTLPDMFSLSLMHALNDKIDLLADVTFTRWSEIDRVNVVAPSGATLDTLVLDFDDTVRYSLGINYRCSDRFTGKLGIAFDESPVDDQNRTVRLPDNDRKWIAAGGSYKVGQAGKLDFGYAYLFTSDGSIDQTRGSQLNFGRVAGTYEASIHIVSVQYSTSF
jgi:long-chain fatty acid transport protein